MNRFALFLLFAVLLTGCASQAQSAQNQPNVEDRLRAIEAQQQAILEEIKAIQRKQNELERSLKDIERKQRELESAQEDLRSQIRRQALRGSSFDLLDVPGTAPVKTANCEDPYTILQKKLDQVDGVLTNAGFAELVDMALAEYEACLKAAGR